MNAVAMQKQPEPLSPEDSAAVARAIAGEAARLDDVAYDLAREQLAANAGLRVSTLDTERAKLRSSQKLDADIQGAAVLFHEPELWPDSVDGAAVLCAVSETLAGYVHLPDCAADVIALWVAATHGFKYFTHAPRLNVTAATRGCGKTLLLDVLATLCPRALRVENLTPAVLFRMIAKEHPTLLVDEVDRYLRDNPELVGLLNSGFTRGGVALRCEGDSNELRAFPVFAPVALSGIGELPGTLHDRSIVLRLERARPHEIRRRFDSRQVDTERQLNAQLRRWTDEYATALMLADPRMPAGAFNRAADVWRPLLSVATVAGGDWPNRAAKAFLAIQQPDADSEPMAVQLLQDVAAVMDAGGYTIMASAALVDKLAELNERPWQTWNRGRLISPRQVASLLRGFGIRPAPRREGGEVFKGYRRADFTDALSRYASQGEVLSVTELQAAPDKDFGETVSVTQAKRVTDDKTPEAAPVLGCNRVTDKSPPKTPMDDTFDEAEAARQEAIQIELGAEL